MFDQLLFHLFNRTSVRPNTTACVDVNVNGNAVHVTRFKRVRQKKSKILRRYMYIKKRYARGAWNGNDDVLSFHDSNIAFIKVLWNIGCVCFVIFDLSHVATKLGKVGWRGQREKCGSRKKVDVRVYIPIIPFHCCVVQHIKQPTHKVRTDVKTRRIDSATPSKIRRPKTPHTEGTPAKIYIPFLRRMRFCTSFPTSSAAQKQYMYFSTWLRRLHGGKQTHSSELT